MKNPLYSHKIRNILIIIIISPQESQWPVIFTTTIIIINLTQNVIRRRHRLTNWETAVTTRRRGKYLSGSSYLEREFEWQFSKTKIHIFQDFNFIIKMRWDTFPSILTVWDTQSQLDWGRKHQNASSPQKKLTNLRTESIDRFIKFPHLRIYYVTYILSEN